MRFTMLLILLIALFCQVGASAEPLLLSDNAPLTGVYFFTHWWEPWKSSDAEVISDLKLLKSMGYNTIFLDHEWSQAIGDWSVLDRDHNLAKKAGMQILPWLSLKVWQDIGTPAYRKVFLKQTYGVDLDLGVDKNGKTSRTKPYDPAVVDAGVRYCREYLNRYLKNGAILHVLWNGKLRPVVALSVELGWEGSYDSLTRQMFQIWAEAMYGMDLDRLNKAWGTSFSRFDEIDLNNRIIFDQNNYCIGKAQYPKAIEDYIEFRSQTVNSCLSRIKEQLLREYPDILIAAELPYQLGSLHPDAINYRITFGANPSSAYHADILVIRATDILTNAEQHQLMDYKARTKQKIILTYRTYQNWGERLLSDKANIGNVGKKYADQAATIAEGLGFYSWNEMVDTHVVWKADGVSNSPDFDRFNAVVDCMKCTAYRFSQIENKK